MQRMNEPNLLGPVSYGTQQVEPSWCQKSSPWSQGRKTPFGRKERTYDVLSIQRESGNGTKNSRKKRHTNLQINKKKKKKKKHVCLSCGCYV